MDQEYGHNHKRPGLDELLKSIPQWYVQANELYHSSSHSYGGVCPKKTYRTPSLLLRRPLGWIKLEKKQEGQVNVAAYSESPCYLHRNYGIHFKPKKWTLLLE